MFFLAISLLSGKFPPSLSLAKKYIDDLLHAKENYIAAITKSQKMANQVSDQVANQESTEETKNDFERPSSDNLNRDDISNELKEIRVQLLRIEKQNRQILENQKK
jgi:hypothetical protein